VYHKEPILRDGRSVRRLTSGAYGHYLGAAIGLGYVPVEPGESDKSVLASLYSIEVASECYPALASLRPLYDPRAYARGTRLTIGEMR
jgi:4-methylaminobutanoate oxidase (formaldehyde-forming)